MAITATNIYTLAAQFVQDEGFNTNAEAEYLSAANEAEKRLTESLKVSVTTDETTDTVDGTQKYSLPADYMAMYEDGNAAYGPVKYYNATTTKYDYPYFVTFKTIMELNFTDLYDLQGTPKYCWADVKNQLWFYPTPDITGTNNVTISYYNYSTTLAAAETESDYPSKYLYALAYLTASVISELNELDADVAKFTRKAELRLLSIAVSGDKLDTGKNVTNMRYTG